MSTTSVPDAHLQLPCAPERADDFLSEPGPEVAKTVTGLSGTVLVLGAGGKMGLHLSLMLRKAAAAANPSLRIVAVSRFQTLRDRDAFHAGGVETIACDLSDAQAVAALPDSATIYFLAGVKFGTSSSPQLLEQMNVVVPTLVAERYRNSRIVAFSTGCVYPFVPVDSGGATEDTPPAPVGEYAESCRKRELAFANAAEKHGTKVALIRLNYSIEFRYGVLVDIATKVLHNEPIDATTGHVNLIWQRDAVDQIIRCVDLTAAPARPINITGPGTHVVRDLARDFALLFGKSSVTKGNPKESAWLNNASLSHRLLGMPPTSLAQMQRWIAAWLVAGGTTWGKPTGFEKRDGKF